MSRSLTDMGYHEPTQIQKRTIPLLRRGVDVIAQAQTGTGKTAGFGIPLIETINPQQRNVQAIVLVPTRELCLQVADELTRLAAHAGVRVIAVYGGVGLGRQIEGLKHGAQIVVGTPGRVEDLLQRKALNLSGVHLAILDEADRMLDVGFLPAIERILRHTPEKRQTALFSATLPPEVRRLALRHMQSPATVEVDPERATVEQIDQRFERMEDGDKLTALAAYLDDPACYLALVFRRTTYRADRLVRDLSRRGYKAAVIHGRRSQSQRERALEGLKSGKVQVLVATDIAARGLDISGLTHVFNYDMPDTPEAYVHRIGRTGRAGETGIAVTFVTPDDEPAVRALKRHLSPNDAATPTNGRPGRRAQPSDTGRPATSTARPAPRHQGRPPRRRR